MDNVFQNPTLCTDHCSLYTARMLFDKKHQKKVRIIWGVLAVMIALSMILLYFPVFR